MRPFVLVVLLAGLVPVPAFAQPAPAAAGEPSAAYYFLLGRHLENGGRIDDAVAAHRKAIELAPKSAEPYGELAGLYARQNRALEAVQAAEAALERDPDNREGNRILGSVLAALGEQRQPLRPGEDPSTYAPRAIRALEKVRRDNQQYDVNVELMLGRLYIQAGQHANAIAPLRRVVDDQPGYPEGAMLLAAALIETNQRDAAIATLEGSVKENPGFFRGFVKLAELYEEQRRFKEAAGAYAAAARLNSRVDLTAVHASALINAGQPAEARDLLQAAVKRRTAPDASLLYLLAQAQRRLGDRAGLAATVTRLKQDFPADLRGLYLDAQLAEDEGRKEDAIAAFKALIAKVPQDPSFVYQYANLLEETGRVAEAERALRDLLARDPLDANALNSLGYMFANRGERLDEAVELLQRAVKIEPANPSFLDSLGWAYFRQGRLELADEPLTKAASGLPQSSVVQDHLGDLRLKQQRFADAALAWEKSLGGDGQGIDKAEIEKKLRDARSRIKSPRP